MWKLGFGGWRWVYQDEVDNDAGDAGGGGAGADGGAAGADAGGGAGADDAGAGTAADTGAAGEPGAAEKEGAPKDMKSAIDAALGYKKPGEGGDLPNKEQKPAEKKGAPGASAGEDKHPNGQPKKNEKGDDLDDKGQVIKKAPPKAKTAAELDLTADERKVLGAKAQARFSEVIGTLKAHEGTIATLTDQNKQLNAAREAIMGALQDARCDQDLLAGYLEFNAMITSGDAKQIERAIGILENQRAALYKAIGKEPAGGDVDLLADFPDLAQKVAESQITRADALELAQGRRERAAREDATRRQQEQQQSKTQTAEQQKRAADDALASITSWTDGLAKSDLDYKAKEGKLLAKVEDVVKNYAPSQWLPTLKMLYEGIVVEKAPAPSGKGNQPLRPSGAKPGDKKPANMLEAINQRLGYAQDKG